MKKVTNIVFSVLFFLAVALPLVTAEYGHDIQSEIDNAYLPELDNLTVETAGEEISNYLDKRIGLRAEALTAYQKLNDRLFGVMEHPTYMYGENGQVFFKGEEFIRRYQHLDLDAEKTEGFADAMKNFQDYTEGTGRDFLYFYIPDKETVYPEYYPKGVNVKGDVSLTDQILGALDKNGVDYYYAKDVMQAHKSIYPVNNKKYDVGHWNDYGAFVAIRGMYEVLQKDHPALELLSEDEFNKTVEIMPSLPVSQFEINEEFLTYTLKETAAVDTTEQFFEERDIGISYPDNVYQHFDNPACADKPKLLIFGDSYLGNGYLGPYERYFINHFSEYTFIHRYNVYNQEFFEYYVDKVDPDIVIFENPERSHIIDLYQDKALP